MKEKYIVAGFLFIACAGLVVLLTMKGFNSPNKLLTKQDGAPAGTISFEQKITEGREGLSDADDAFLDSQTPLIKDKDTAKAFAATRRIINFWDSLHRYDIAGYYFSLIYERSKSELALMNASKLYYEYAAQSMDSVYRGFLMNKAAGGFKKVLEINPGNLDAKVGSALCIVEDRAQIMTAVPLLREVLAADSNHVQARFSLGILQIESGQLEKALISFQKLVSLQPFEGRNYFYLAEIQQKLGNITQALKNYEKAKILVGDERTKAGIDDIIKDLKK